MAHRVLLSAAAEEDLYDLHRYVAGNDSPLAADRLLDRLEQAMQGLENLPDRGRTPPELERIGVAMYREALCGPYRILYRAAAGEVLVLAVVDGRRDLRDVLMQRLLR